MERGTILSYKFKKGWPMEAILKFQQVVNDPATYLQTIKGRRKIIGYCCTYAPEEIIYAAGVHPVRIFGTKAGISRADAHLQAYSCSLVRGVLEDALAGNLNVLDGMIFPHTCDSIQRLSDIWRLNCTFTWHADVVLPVKLDTDAARTYMVDVLKKFRRELEAWLGAPITDEALRQSYATYNRLRALLKRVYELRSANPALIRGSEVAALVKGSMIMDRAEAVALLEDVVQSLEKAAVPAGAGERKRILVSGGLCDHPEIYDIIEASGGVVVWDDLCSGSRFFEGQIALAGDPIEALAQRFLDRIICPAKHLTNTARGENLVRIARDHQASGVVFLLLKFCDPHAFDYPYLKGFLDQASIPSMLLEIEQELPSSGQLATRFEAFVGML